jgi:hypothetical protein
MRLDGIVVMTMIMMELIMTAGATTEFRKIRHTVSKFIFVGASLPVFRSRA